MATIGDLYKALKTSSETLSEFRKQWETLTSQDKEDLKLWWDVENAVQVVP